MRAGNLRNYVTIQSATESFDGNGELILTWATFASVWAEVTPLVGREYFASKQVNAEVTGKVRIRYLAGVTSEMRIIDGTKTYQIEAVMNIENRNEELVLLVKEVF
jgi:SPP1 family predicted phage head-tail adaptor